MGAVRAVRAVRGGPDGLVLVCGSQPRGHLARTKGELTAEFAENAARKLDTIPCVALAIPAERAGPPSMK